MAAVAFTLLTLMSLQLLVQGGRNDEEKLADYLSKKLKEQGSIARPVLQAKDNVTVQVGLTLLRLLAPQGDSVEVDAYVRLSWRDPRLTWDSTSGSKRFGSIKSMAMSADSIWLPDIRTYSVFGLKLDKEAPIRVLISKNGTINYVQPARARFDCDRPWRNSYMCQIKLGSWVHSGKQVDIRLSQYPMDLSKLQTFDWIVSDSGAAREASVYPCYPDEQFVAAAFNITVSYRR